jgi:large subunit ribosomal protein L33
MRDHVTLACSDCKRRNYTTTKNKRKHPDRVEHKKYCPFCRTHKVHKETR